MTRIQMYEVRGFSKRSHVNSSIVWIGHELDKCEHTSASRYLSSSPNNTQKKVFIQDCKSILKNPD